MMLSFLTTQMGRYIQSLLIKLRQLRFLERLPSLAYPHLLIEALRY